MELAVRQQPTRSQAVVQIPCTALVRLVKQYDSATARLTARVAEMTEHTVYADDETFETGWCACEEARAILVLILKEIYQHARDHHCALEIGRRPPKRSIGR